MPHDGRSTRVAVVVTPGGLGLARSGASLAAALAVLGQQDLVLVTNGGDDAELRRKVPDGLWSFKDPGPSGVVHGPQRKGRGGKIKRW